MPRPYALPPNLPPRLISREAAAEYVSVSPNTFDAMVNDGSMPKPKKLSDRRQAWDVRELDAAIDRLPKKDDAPATGGGWEDVDDAAQATAVR